jgi:predicted site-specific integrase-resolvase
MNGEEKKEITKSRPNTSKLPRDKTKYISIREASIITGINAQTLRKLGDENKIKCYKTLSGQRKFDKSYLEKMCNNDDNDDKIDKDTKKNYIYTRVSSKKQSDDLSRQVEFIKNKRTEYTSYISISDIGSGINFNRKGLTAILDAALQGTLGEVIVAHRDRLCRFGFDLIKLIIEKQGGKITVLDDERNKSSEQELSEDLLSIVHIYSCRQMGKRSYKAKIENIKNTIKNESTTTENN